MTRREAAVYLGYVLIFSTVVAWAYLRYAPHPATVHGAAPAQSRMTAAEPARDIGRDLPPAAATSLIR